MSELEIGLVDGGHVGFWSIFPAVECKEKDICEEFFSIWI